MWQVPDEALSLTRFNISPSGGLVQPGQSVIVTVSYSPENANAHRETLSLKVRRIGFYQLCWHSIRHWALF